MLKILSYNIHKGMNWNKAAFTLRSIKETLMDLSPDIAFFQEVMGENEKIAQKFDSWPKEGQFEFLADQIWDEFAYAKNAVYPHGHHGNALMSKFPIIRWDNHDISTHRLENRGMLHSVIKLPHKRKELHTICLHLSLFDYGRKIQYRRVCDFVNSNIPPDAPLIIAGDLNDWNLKASLYFENQIGMTEAFKYVLGSYAKTFPAHFPFLRLDRIYIRNLRIQNVTVHPSNPMKLLSDHLPLSIDVNIP